MSKDSQMRNSKDKYPIYCPNCGERMWVSFEGTYEDVYKITKKGTISKKRVRQYFFPYVGGYKVSCSKCDYVFKRFDNAN